MRVTSAGKTINRGPKQAVLLFLILLLVTQACAAPFRLSPQATQPAATTTAPAQPTQAAAQPKSLATITTPAQSLQPAPPLLAEAIPAPGSVIPANAGLVFYFNVPMDAESLQRGLEFDPPHSGKQEWLDDATLRFTPDHALPPDTALQVTFNQNVRSRAGDFLPAPVTLAYRTAAALRVLEQFPAPQSDSVDPSAALFVAFNQPVVALGEENDHAPAGFTLQPAAQGRGAWINTSTYAFYPQPALRGGVTYRAQVNPELVTDASADWTFRTAAPQVTSLLERSPESVPLDEPLILTFNQPMDAASVAANFTLMGPEGAVAGDFTWNEDFSEASFAPQSPLVRQGSYRLALAGAAQSAGGTPLSAEYSVAFLTVPPLAYVGISPDNGAGETLQVFENNYGLVELQFNVPLDPAQDFTRLVEFDPPVENLSAYLNEDHTQVSLSGFFRPGLFYVLRLSENIRDRWGQPLGETIGLGLRTAPARPAFSIPMLQAGTNILFVTPQETSIPAQATNLSVLEITSGSLSIENFLRLASDPREEVGAARQLAWQQALTLTPDESTPVGLELTAFGEGLPPGLYSYQVRSPQLDAEAAGLAAPFLVVSSNVQLTLKRGSQRAFVWATDLQSNQPAGGLPVFLFDNTGALLASGETGDDGSLALDLPPGLDPYNPLYAVSGDVGKVDFSLATTQWNQGVSGWEFGLPVSAPQQLDAVYLYTDRPVYRPGQQVHYRVALRARDGGAYRLPGAQSVVVQVNGPGATPDAPFAAEQTLALSAFGTASADLQLPADAAPGFYSLTVKDRQASGVGFQVASYRKPEIELRVAFAEHETVLAEDLRAALTASYYFGAPAAGLPVTWTLTAQPEALALPDGYQSGPLDTGWLDPDASNFNNPRVIQTGEGQTAADGSLETVIALDTLRDLLQSGVRYRLQLEALTQEESGSPVSARAEMLLDPAAFTVGLRAGNSGVRAGEQASFDVRVFDLAGAPAGEHRLSALFQKITWQPGDTPDPFTGALRYEAHFTPVASTDFVTDAEGRARLAFNPQEVGSYALEVRGEGALSALMIWVAGAGTPPWPQLPNQRLPISAASSDYQPGETAQIFVPNPFDGEALALVTVERSDVLRWMVVPVQAAGQNIALSLEAADAPNVYVAVLLLGQDQDGRNDFRQGYLRLGVQPNAHLLDVSLSVTPQTPAPGETVQMNLQARDAAGQPVAAEFSLAVVDRAALALAEPNAPDITTAFYGEQPLAVVTGMSLAAHASRAVVIQPGRGGGGGAAAADIREQFEDTAYWNGTVVTDAQGRAQVSVPLPDNLTTWVLDARGITRETQVGAAQADLIVSKPLLVRPVTPRFLVQGDHVRLAAQVHNNTAQALNATVRLDAAGVQLDDPAAASQMVEIGAGARAQVIWWVTALDAETADLIFSASAGDLSDVTRPAAGRLPIFTYQSAQTFSTGGMLDAAGERREYISLPRTYTPTGGSLRVELSASLAAGLLGELQQLQPVTGSDPQQALSAMLPALEGYRAIQALGGDVSALETQVQAIVAASMGVLRETQKTDGGWGWQASDPWLSAYALFALARAAQSGVSVPQAMLAAAQEYVRAQLAAPPTGAPGWQFDRAVFLAFALQESGATLDLTALAGDPSGLSPWAAALLAVILQQAAPEDVRTADLEQFIRASVVRSATGAHWDAGEQGRPNNASTLFTSAVVLYSLARLDPASTLLPEAVRYLFANRKAGAAGWANDYETAWALLALAQAMRGVADPGAQYDSSASLNGALLIAGAAEDAATTMSASVPLEILSASRANTLVIERGAGAGRLYYRADLQIHRPAEDAPPIAQGMILTRSYYLLGQETPITSVQIGQPAPVILVRLTLTLPHDALNVVVEDSIPAGAEILDLSLATTPQTSAEVVSTPIFDPADPFGQGWRWWLFQSPQISDSGLRWFARDLPAGVYQLTYRIVATQPGEFRVLPARAYEYYFPETQGSSAGGILTIQP